MVGLQHETVLLITQEVLLSSGWYSCAERAVKQLQKNAIQKSSFVLIVDVIKEKATGLRLNNITTQRFTNLFFVCNKPEKTLKRIFGFKSKGFLCDSKLA